MTYNDLLKGIGPSLKGYIEETIIPRYAGFDKAHREDHARSVIERAMLMADSVDAGGNCSINRNILYAAAACHDLGLAVDRATHHLESGRIIREDSFLRSFFGPQELETVAQAAEDHRASSKSEPRGIYGRLVAEADRLIEPYTIIRRTVQFGLDHYPELGSARLRIFGRNTVTAATCASGSRARPTKPVWKNCAASSGTNANCGKSSTISGKMKKNFNLCQKLTQRHRTFAS